MSLNKIQLEAWLQYLLFPILPHAILLIVICQSLWGTLTSYLSVSTVWEERPGGRQDHREAVWRDAAGVQRRPVTETQADAEGLEEDV